MEEEKKLLLICLSATVMPSFSSSFLKVKGCIIEMEQTQLMLFVSGLGLHAFVLDDREDVFVFPRLLGNSDIATASKHSKHVCIPYEGGPFNIMCKFERLSTNNGTLFSGLNVPQ